MVAGVIGKPLRGLTNPYQAANPQPQMLVTVVCALTCWAPLFLPQQLLHSLFLL